MEEYMSQENIIGEILVACQEITTYRDEQTVFKHLKGEVDELDIELNKKYFGRAPGADGILGESVDVILCAVDMIYQDNPDVSYEDILRTVMKKIAKWKRIYG